MEQMTIFDFIKPPEPPKRKEYPLGYKDADGRDYDIKHRGEPIRFQDLEQYVGRKVLQRVRTSSAEYYRLIRIIKYMKQSTGYYVGEKEKFCDRIVATDKDRGQDKFLYIDEYFYESEFCTVKKKKERCDCLLFEFVEG